MTIGEKPGATDSDSYGLVNLTFSARSGVDKNLLLLRAEDGGVELQFAFSSEASGDPCLEYAVALSRRTRNMHAKYDPQYTDSGCSSLTYSFRTWISTRNVNE